MFEEHTDKDDGIEPSFGLSVQVQIALSGRKNEWHRDDIHLFRSTYEATYC